MMAPPPQKKELDPAERRKLIKEVKEEVKPVITQIANFQIEESLKVIKNNIRKIETEHTVDVQQLYDKIAFVNEMTCKDFTEKLAVVRHDLEDEIRTIQKQRARDRTDIELRYADNTDFLKRI